MENNKQPFVSITPVNAKIQINWGYYIHTTKEDDGMYSCYIPSFDIHFSSSNHEDIKNKGKRLTKSLLQYFMDEPRNGLKKYILHLHKLGFKAPNDTMTIKHFIENKAVKTKFKSIRTEVPNGFSESLMANSEMELDLV